MRTACWLVLLALGMLAGCAPQEPPPEPVERLVVYSLEPMLRKGEVDAEPGDEWFDKYFVSGSTAVTDPMRQRAILDAVRQGIEEADQDPTVHKMCEFMPRHGLRHVAKDGTVTEWLICFSCEQVKVLQNGVQLGLFEKEDWHGSGRYKTGKGNITHGPQKLLNDTLRTAGVKLAAGAEKGE
jgi:hypothetical protein